MEHTGVEAQVASAAGYVYTLTSGQLAGLVENGPGGRDVEGERLAEGVCGDGVREREEEGVGEIVKGASDPLPNGDALTIIVAVAVTLAVTVALALLPKEGDGETLGVRLGDIVRVAVRVRVDVLVLDREPEAVLVTKCEREGVAAWAAVQRRRRRATQARLCAPISDTALQRKHTTPLFKS